MRQMIFLQIECTSHIWKFCEINIWICVFVHWTQGSSRKRQSQPDCVAATIRHKHKICKNFKFTSNCSHWNVICPCLKRQSILVKLCKKKGMKRAIIISPFVHFLLWLLLSFNFCWSHTHILSLFCWANFCCCLAHTTHTNLHPNPSLDNSCTRSDITCKNFPHPLVWLASALARAHIHTLITHTYLPWVHSSVFIAA